MIRLPSKHPDEIVDIPYDFKNEMNGAEFTGLPVFSIVVDSGADANVALMPHGAPVVQGTAVIQRVKLGVRKVLYYTKVVAQLSDGRVLVRDALLPVLESGRDHE